MDAVNIWITYKTEICRRKDWNPSWYSIATEYKTFLVR